MFDPAFLVVWLLSLTVLCGMVLRFALRAALTAWFLLAHVLAENALLMRTGSVSSRASRRSLARIAAPRRQEVHQPRSGADSRAVA